MWKIEDMELDAVKTFAREDSKEHWAVVNNKIAIYRPKTNDYILGVELKQKG